MRQVLKRIILILENGSFTMENDTIEELFKDTHAVLDTRFLPIRLKSRRPDSIIYPQLSFIDIALPPGKHSLVPKDQDNILIVRADFEKQEDIDKVRIKPEVKGCFADPDIAVFPDSSNDADIVPDVNDIKRAIGIDSLKSTGKGVKIAIVDTGINGTKDIGGLGKITVSGGWHPFGIDYEIGKAIPGHGTMCAFDTRICAPESQIYDYALALGQNWNALLSDALAAFADLIRLQQINPGPLVVNNSWGLYNRDTDAPIGSSENFSSNPGHPFNQIVGSLVASGADVFFSAGNCGKTDPDFRCGSSDVGPGKSIHGANSHPDVITVAAVDINGKRFQYSSQGPGGLYNQKPDIAAYSEFKGSGIRETDGGTSAACPVAVGLAAALREKISNTKMNPYSFKSLLLRNAIDVNNTGWNYNTGYGIINASNLAKYITDSYI